jgi:hypothetical protein
MLERLPDFVRRKIVPVKCPISSLKSDCWLLNTAPNGHGYGQITVHYKKWEAHKFIWSLLREPIPEGLTLDHLCRVPRCCNPNHLEPVTMRINILRGNGRSARNFRKTHCPNGHEFVPANTYHRPDHPRWRDCLKCRREKAKEFKRLRRRAA